MIETRHLDNSFILFSYHKSRIDSHLGVDMIKLIMFSFCSENVRLVFTSLITGTFYLNHSIRLSVCHYICTLPFIARAGVLFLRFLQLISYLSMIN